MITAGLHPWQNAQQIWADLVLACVDTPAETVCQVVASLGRIGWMDRSDYLMRKHKVAEPWLE